MKEHLRLETLKQQGRDKKIAIALTKLKHGDVLRAAYNQTQELERAVQQLEYEALVNEQELYEARFQNEHGYLLKVQLGKEENAFEDANQQDSTDARESLILEILAQATLSNSPLSERTKNGSSDTANYQLNDCEPKSISSASKAKTPDIATKSQDGQKTALHTTNSTCGRPPSTK
jgi:hypothetical protein